MSMADQDEATAAVVEGLKRLYHSKLKPLEQTYMFGWFHSPPLTDSEFESKPQVLMCGQYSTGKTSVSGAGQGRRGGGVGGHIFACACCVLEVVAAVFFWWCVIVVSCMYSVHTSGNVFSASCRSERVKSTRGGRGGQASITSSEVSKAKTTQVPLPPRPLAPLKTSTVYGQHEKF